MRRHATTAQHLISPSLNVPFRASRGFTYTISILSCLLKIWLCKGRSEHNKPIFIQVIFIMHLEKKDFQIYFLIKFPFILVYCLTHVCYCWYNMLLVTLSGTLQIVVQIILHIKHMVMKNFAIFIKELLCTEINK